MGVKVRLPLPDEQVFRYGAMDDILEIAATNPSTKFSNRDLQELTGFGGPSVTKAVSLLEAMGLLIRQDTGAKTLYQINERSLFDADDPFLGIPQAEFREPLKRFVNQVGQELSTDAAILCFGSVARGDADRVSDIDLFVLVGDDEELVTARRAVSEVVRELETEPIDGQRYEFEVFVESPESARRRGEDLQPILQEGIVLSESEAFRRVKGEVFGGIEE